ncbi:MAG: ABC transporter ATP-binding protein [Alphaproteobacteria bacterium]|nr:ABC transporter ATP-binding protein [Alphaproteobacteria bacterium]
MLEALALSKTFTARRRGRAASAVAVDRVDLAIAAGECVGLVGESGCGKSTVARLLLRLIEPDGGDILLEGRSIRTLAGAELRAMRRHVQIVFQNPHSALHPRMSVGAAIAEPLLIQGLAGSTEARQRALAMLDVVGLPRSFAYRYPHELSGGQKQRICIARALILRPQLIVLDEPTSALDVSVQAQILEFLGQMQREFGLSYLLISHNLAVVRAMSRRIMVMYRGQIVEQGTTEALLSVPRHPYTRALLAASLEPEPGVSLPPAEVDLPVGEGTSVPACRFFARCERRVAGLCDREVPPIAGAAESWAWCHRPHGGAT